MTDLDLDAIEARANAATEAFNARTANDREWCHEAAVTALDSSADVPALVAEVRRLRAEVVTLECERAPQELVDHLADERDAARAEAERLRGELDAAEGAMADIAGERAPAVAEAARVREALQAVRDILDWLTSMGEPTLDALETRRVVTLGDIISRARAALRALDAALGSHPDESENPTKEMDHA